MPGPAGRIHRAGRPEPPTAQGLSATDRGAGSCTGDPHDARKFTHFLPFGLTSSWLRPTVTVR